MARRILVLQNKNTVARTQHGAFHSPNRTFEIDRIDDVKELFEDLEKHDYEMLVINDDCSQQRNLAEQVKRKFPKLTILYNWEILEKKLQENQKYMADYDTLTQLFNRGYFEQHLKRCVHSASRLQSNLCLLYIDLDDFKHVNDEYGHGIGDQLLVHAAFRMQASLRHDDCLARLGGDEFCVILSDLDDINDASTVAEKILASLSLPYHIENLELMTSASIGIAVCPQDADTPDELLRKADMAMYNAKKETKHTYRFYSKELEAAHQAQILLESQLAIGFKKQEFYLEYQPILNIINNQVVGYEALLRWRNEILGMVPPNEIIPIAEKTGLIHDLGKWIIDTGINELKDKLVADPHLYLAFNLSTRQLTESFFKFLDKDLWKHKVEKSQIRFEFTEKQLANGDIPTNNLTHFAAMGIQIGIDDFGASRSNITDLLDLPLAYIKIDRAFVHGKLDKDKLQKLHTIIEVSKILGIDAIAEGIENKEQMQALALEYCQLGQGYLLGYPTRVELKH